MITPYHQQIITKTWWRKASKRKIYTVVFMTAVFCAAASLITTSWLFARHELIKNPFLHAVIPGGILMGAAAFAFVADAWLCSKRARWVCVRAVAVSGILVAVLLGIFLFFEGMPRWSFVAYPLGVAAGLPIGILVGAWAGATSKQTVYRVRMQSFFICPKCGYELHRLQSPGCPECGWNQPANKVD